MNLDVQKVAAKLQNPVELMGGQLDLLIFGQVKLRNGQPYFMGRESPPF